MSKCSYAEQKTEYGSFWRQNSGITNKRYKCWDVIHTDSNCIPKKLFLKKELDLSEIQLIVHVEGD